MEVQIFGTKKSADTRKALRFFSERRVRTHFVDLQQRAAAPGELRRFAQKFGVQALIDTNSRRFAELGLARAHLSDERWIDRLADEPMLLRVPLVRWQQRLSVGFAETIGAHGPADELSPRVVRTPRSGSPADPRMATLAIIITLSLGISFLCSILESVLLSITHSYVAVLQENEDRVGNILARMRANIDEPIAAILTLNTISHTIGAAMGGAIALQVFGDRWIALFSAVLTLAILIFSEILPKTIGATTGSCSPGPWRTCCARSSWS
jgi:arsenate reductase (glutaredoxin)